MSTLGWIALVLAALAVALLLWLLPRRARRFAADSPRTVADLVRLRAEQAEPVEPEDAPAQAVVVPEPRAVAEEAPAEAEPIVEVAPSPDERQAVPVRVSASADDTPWNRAARIAENAGIVWATDHGSPARAPEPVLRPVRLPAFPPDLVATRSTMPAADPGPVAQGGAGGGTAGSSDAGAEEIAGSGGRTATTGTATTDTAAGVAGPGAAPTVVVESLPAEGAAVVEPVPTVTEAAEPVVTEAAAVVDPLSTVTEAAEPVVTEAAAVVEPVPTETEAAGSDATEPVAVEPARAGEPVERSAHAAPSAAEPVRSRRTPAETAAEQAAADLALLRTFGCADPAESLDEPSTVSLEGACCVAAAPEAVPGAAQTVAFRVVGRDGEGVPGAGVTLLDDRGGEAAGAVADAGGRGTVVAPHPGGYVLVSAADGHQPGAVAITVAGEPVSADLLLARSASLSGTVHGEDGPVVGARLTLVQDGEIVDTAVSGPGGAYRIADLAAGEYGLSVTAVECEPAAVLVTVPDETEHHHDVELEPAGLNRSADDMMIGLG